MKLGERFGAGYLLPLPRLSIRDCFRSSPREEKPQDFRISAGFRAAGKEA